MITEQIAATERREQGEHTSRRHAVAGLAADMLYLFGEAEDRWRSITWQDGDRTYSLNRGDSTQYQSQQTGEHANWLYVSGPGDEYDAYSLDPDGEFAAPDHLFGDIADAINRQATATIYAVAAQKMQEIPKSDGNIVFARNDDIGIVFRDFTDAAEPFILMRLGDMAEGDLYDISPSEISLSDKRYAAGPVQPQDPHEAHLRWVMHSVVAAQRASRYELMYIKARRPERTTPAPIDSGESGSLSGHNISEAHGLMRGIKEWPAHENLYVHRGGDTVVVRAVFWVDSYDHDLQARRSDLTALGIYYDGKQLRLEAFRVENPAERVRVTLALDRALASGEARTADRKYNCDGNIAASAAFEFTDALNIAHADGQLQSCTPDIAEKFELSVIRGDSQNNPVQ